MKNIKKVILLLMILCISTKVDALCNDNELNEWATSIDVEFTKYHHDQNSSYKDLNIAYFLSITNYRDDIYFEVFDEAGYSLKDSYIEEYDKHGVGCFTNINKETYTIKVYGAKGSKCENELLRILNYTVEPYNEYSKTAFCETYPEHELCETYKDTSNVTWKEFEEERDKYTEEHQSKTVSILQTIIEYAVYMIIPFFIITCIYLVIKKKYKEKESKK